MMQRLQRGFAALALVALPGGVLPVRDTDGKVPDLEITVVGVKDPGKPREVTIRVTNVGPAWADHTAATVRAEPAGAGEVLEGRDVLDLSPIGQEEEQDTPSRFEFTYTLAAPCGAQEVKLRAGLTAGKDWEGDPEKNLANNVIPRPGHDGVVCPGQATTAPPPQNPGGLGAPIDPNTPIGGVLKPGRNPAVGAITAEVNRHPGPGTWSQTLKASATRVAIRKRDIASCFSPNPLVDLVGWYQHDPDNVFTRQCWWYTQMVVGFDLSFLDGVPKKTVDSAALLYKEEPSTWQSGEGGFEHKKDGCVGGIGRATSDWAAQPDGGPLFAYEPLGATFTRWSDGSPGWDVPAGLINDWLSNQKPRLGLVLRGSNENLEGSDETSCVSHIREVSLVLTYTVPN